MNMNLNELENNLRDPILNTVPVPNFKPQWINNITRLNAQNLNSKMYTSIKDFTESYGKAVLSTSNTNLTNLIKLLPGKKVSDISTSEIHNIDFDLASTNEALGNYQAVFGTGNKTNKDVDGQFIIGKYNKVGDNFIFAVGNGDNDNARSNALEVSLDGTIKTANINVINGITTPYVSLTQIITDSSDDKYAATKKYVFDKVKTETDRAVVAENLLTTNLNEEISRAKAEEDSIRAIASSAFHFKGSKPSYNDLPKTGNTVGDVWQVDDKEYAWNGTEWVELGFNIDLTPYIKTIDAEAKIATAKTEAITSANSYTDTAVSGKQDTLVSGSNIKALKDDITSAQSLLGSGNINFKTINGASLFGTGNITIEGGGTSITVDDSLSSTSTNPVQNKVINAALENKQDAFTYDSGTWSTTFDKGIFFDIKRTTDNQLLTINVGDLLINSQEVSILKNADLSFSSNNEAVFTFGTTSISAIGGVDFKGYTPGGSVINIPIVNVPKIEAPTDNMLVVDAKQDLSLTTANYSMSWDTTSQAIKITFN